LKGGSVSIWRIIGPPSLAMPYQPTVFDKLPDMLFYRVAIGLRCRRKVGSPEVTFFMSVRLYRVRYF
jgi:hypothetical protein